MGRLEDMRRSFEVEKPRDLPTQPGQFAASFNEPEFTTVRNRFLMEACLACGRPQPAEIGLRHGGIHYRCPACTFEFTRKPFTEDQLEEAKKHLMLLGQAAVRHTAEIVKQQARRELYQNARKEYRRGWELITLPNGTKDATLYFGVFRDQLVSEIVDTPRGRTYLRWMKTADFDDELMEIVESYIDGTDGR